MGKIERYDVNEQWAHSGIIKAGDFCFLGYCVGNIGGSIEEQINGAFNNMEERLAMVGLTLESVVQMDCLFTLLKKLRLYYEYLPSYAILCQIALKV